MERHPTATNPASRDGIPRPVIAHPDELNTRLALGLGSGASLVVTARATPAGLRAAAVLVSAILVSAAVLVRAARRRP